MAARCFTKPLRICKFPDCGRAVESYGLCASHRRQQRKGRKLSPLKRMRSPGSLPVIAYTEAPCPVSGLVGPCWLFAYCKTEDGYGLTSLNNKLIYVHRYVWERDVGPIPAGMFIDHRCRSRACCNVDHLRVVTPAVNAKENRAKPKAKSHCIRGHILSDDNLCNSKDGRRRCRLCHRLRSRRGAGNFCAS
jgi:hypothetical protein